MLDPSTLVSVVISNYNYAQFVGAAIESALALDWPHIEVIVVDDGSTDDSLSVIEHYAGRVQLLVQQNTGNAGAYQNGFGLSKGEIVIFLDADDCLEPRLMQAVAPLWHDSVSKIQVQMRTIDRAGNELGAVLPQYFCVPTPAQVREWMLAAGAYSTPPGSGNVYSRRFLLQVMPFDLSIDRAADTFLLAAAPFFGDVVTLARPLVSYRIHGSNLGAMLRVEGTRMTMDYQRSRRRFEYAQTMARRAGFDLADGAFHRSLKVLVYRAASWRLAPGEHAIPADSAWAIIRDSLDALRVVQGLTLSARFALAIWITVVCLAPRGVAERALNWRFVPSTRPQIMKRMMNALRIARAHPSTFSGRPS